MASAIIAMAGIKNEKKFTHRNKLIVKIVSNSDKDAWDSYVLSHPEGIAYQLFAWQEAVKKAYKFKPLYLMAQAENQVKGILPLIKCRIPFKMELVSLPYCDAGGPLADNPDTEKMLLQEAVKIVPSSTMVIRASHSFGNIPPDQTISTQKTRMLLSLPGSSDNLLASFKAKLRSQISKAYKNGLTSAIGSMDLFNDFYSVFSENMRDLGSPVHSKEWLSDILRFYKNRAHAVVVYTSSGEPAAAGIILCHPKVVSIPWASSLRRFNKLNPNMMLYWAFLKFAADNGYPIFDFGRSTPGEGTFRFKKQWGAEPAPLHWVDRHPSCQNFEACSKTADQDSSNGKLRGTAEKIIQKMPINFSVAFGSLTRKYVTL